MAATAKVAIVTGAAQGIGRSISLQLAKDGFCVIVSDLPTKKNTLEEVATEIKTLRQDVKTLVVCADVSSESDVEMLVETAIRGLGGLDVMVANAGVFYGSSIVDVSVAEWDKLFSINLRGTLLCYKYAAKAMIKQRRGGRLIGASSGLGKKGSAAAAPYAASKAAIRSLTQSTASELGPFGITVNAYAPGVVDTQFMRDGARRLGEIRGAAPDAAIHAWAAVAALKRIGQPDDVAQLVSFLASDKSSFITGQSITIDGGVWFD